jgi:NADH-quinone oxidoreductase subunit G
MAHDVTYEVKKGKILRTSNQAEFTTMCSASRYGFDFANENVSKDKTAFKSAVEAFKEAKSVVFSKEISNEEAFILQQLKERYALKLIAPEVKAYQAFMKAYASVTGKQLDGGSVEELSKSRAIMVLGTRINDDAPLVKFHINKASKWHRARVTYLHPIEDASISNIVTQNIAYEAGNEEAVTAALVTYLLKDVEDVNFEMANESISEADLELLRKSHIKKVGFSLVVGSDLYAHPKADNIAKMIALLEKYAGMNVVVVPPAGNALGVSLICDLDDEVESPSIGYNVKGDFTLSAFGGGDLDMPALNQQEGTLTSMSKRVVPMNVAVAYGGYVLNDIANALGLRAEYTIDYTKSLPTNTGFEAVEFDALKDYFTATGEEHRGYLLNEIEVVIDETIEKVSSVETIKGTVIYNCNPQEHFSPLTAQSENLSSEALLLGSQEFAQKENLTDGDRVCFTIDDVSFERVFKIDTSMKGAIALNPTFDMGLSTALLSSYRFSQVDLEKVGS